MPHNQQHAGRLLRRGGGGGPLPQGARGHGQRGRRQEGGQGGGRGGADRPLQDRVRPRNWLQRILRQGSRGTFVVAQIYPPHNYTFIKYTLPQKFTHTP